MADLQLHNEVHSLIRNFDQEKDLKILNGWLARRGMGSIDHVPENSYVAEMDGVPAAMSMLRMVEGNSYAILDGLASNPDVPGIVRDAALDSVVEVALEAARYIKVKTVVAWSIDKSIIERSKKHGFFSMGHVFIVHRTVDSERLV